MYICDHPLSVDQSRGLSSILCLMGTMFHFLSPWKPHKQKHIGYLTIRKLPPQMGEAETSTKQAFHGPSWHQKESRQERGKLEQ